MRLFITDVDTSEPYAKEKTIRVLSNHKKEIISHLNFRVKRGLLNIRVHGPRNVYRTELLFIFKALLRFFVEIRIFSCDLVVDRQSLIFKLESDMSLMSGGLENSPMHFYYSLVIIFHPRVSLVTENKFVFGVETNFMYAIHTNLVLNLHVHWT